jgi:hypothetical protein
MASHEKWSKKAWSIEKHKVSNLPFTPLYTQLKPLREWENVMRIIHDSKI